MSSDKGDSDTSESEHSHGSTASCDEEMYGNLNLSENSDEFPYDTSVEPIAMAEEHAEYQRVVSLQEAEQQQLAVRFSKEQSVQSW
jgi:hypothetical protein